MKRLFPAVLMAVAVSLCGAQLKINSKIVETGFSENPDGWKFEKKVDLIAGDPPPEFPFTAAHMRKHPTSKYIRGFNGDVVLTLQAPGRISHINVSGTIANFPDSVTREAAFSYSLDGVKFTVVEKKPFGGKYSSKATVGANIDLPINNGYLVLKFERICKPGDRNGLYGNVLWQDFCISLDGTKAAAGKQSSALKINNRIVQTGYVEAPDGWAFAEHVDLLTGQFPEEFLIPAAHIRKHPTSKHIRGYNGNIVLTVQAPSRVKHINAAGIITNFPDLVIREAAFSYSLDGVKFTTVEKKPFGGKHGSRVTVGADIDLPANNGYIVLKFERICKPGDRNGLSGNVLWQNFHITLTGDKIIPVEKKKTVKKLKEIFPTGVFWAWGDRTKGMAAHLKMDLWKLVEQNMLDMKENGYDTCWFIHVDSADQPKLLQLAEKHGLRALITSDVQSIFYHGTDSLDGIDIKADRTVSRIGHSPALYGYILRDEPGTFDLATTNYLYDVMKKADPTRDSISVVMNANSMTYLRDSKMPVICSDLYYFGGDNSTQIPCPRSVSQTEITNGLNNYNTMAELTGKHSWFMGQMFGNIWGRHYFNGKKVVVYPGCYIHWRMPTVAEINWQIWEALRLGSKGIFFYVFHSPVPLETPPEKVTDPAEKKKVERMDQYAATAKSWGKQKLTEKMMEFDPDGGMLDFNGRPTKQMKASAGVLKLIRANETLLVHRRRADFPVFFADDASTDTATFVSDGRWLGIVVNRNLDQHRKVQVLLPKNVREVTNIATGKAIPITDHGKDFNKLSLDLDAGNGVILEAAFFKHPGMLCCKESFDQQRVHRMNITSAGEIINHGNFGSDENRSLRLKKGADPVQPVCVLKAFSNPKSAYNTFSKNIGRNAKRGTFYCQVNGVLYACKVKAVSSEAKVQQSNIMHLKNFKTESDNSTSGMLLQAKDFFRPFVVPSDTTALEFYLNGGYISDIQIWFVPNAKN